MRGRKIGRSGLLLRSAERTRRSGHSRSRDLLSSYPPRMSGMLLVISGPSGVGKTTIARSVEKAFDDSLFSVSVTTRARTGADRDGVDYRFVDDAAFDRMVANNELLEWASVFDKRYGTPRAPVEAALAHGKLMILEIDVRGAVQVREAMPGALGIFILPPTMDDLLERLRARRREPEEKIRSRFAEAKREIADAKACGAYHHFVVNENLDQAIDDVVAIVRQERQRR